MEYILANTLLALLEYPGATLLSVNKMLSDKAFRKKVVDNVTDPSVKAYWTEEFAGYTDRFAAEATPAIQNKIGQFTSNPIIRNIIGQPKSSFDLREMMDEKKIVIINLSKGRVGESNANLLGSMLITKIYLAAMSRADVESSISKLPPFYLYVDEFQSFANESFADILSEARKYKLALTVAHQYIEQMSDEVRAAVFGNVGTMVTFRVGSYDAEVLEKEFSPKFTAEDIVNLGFVQIYLKLMIDGVSSSPFSARTLPPIEKVGEMYKQEVVKMSQQQFGRPKSQVEEIVQALLGISENTHGQPSPKREQPKRNMNNRKSTSQKEKPRLEGAGKNPFKNIVISQDGKIKEKDEKKEAVSLNQLQKKKQTKEPTKEKKNDLKSALAGLIQQPPKKEDTKKQESKDSSQKKMREVPESQLRNILKE